MLNFLWCTLKIQIAYKTKLAIANRSRSAFVADLVEIFLTSVLITVQNSVVVSRTVCPHVRGPTNLGTLAKADLWFLVPWARFPDCAPPPSDGPSDDGFQLNLSVSKFTYLINEYPLHVLLLHIHCSLQQPFLNECCLLLVCYYL